MSLENSIKNYSKLYCKKNCNLFRKNIQIQQTWLYWLSTCVVKLFTSIHYNKVSRYFSTILYAFCKITNASFLQISIFILKIEYFKEQKALISSSCITLQKYAKVPTQKFPPIVEYFRTRSFCLDLCCLSPCFEIQESFLFRIGVLKISF